MKATCCPTHDVLAAFVLGKLPEEQLLQVAEHAKGCRACQGHLRVADGLSDDLIVQIQHTPPPDSSDSVSSLSQLLPRVEKLRTDGGEATSGDISTDGTESSVEVALELKHILAPPQGKDEIGRLGSYRVQLILGAGGMGIVLRAEDPQLHRPVALKLMRASMASHPTARQRFMREAQATAQVRNDHVVTVYQVSEEGGTPFLAMELLEGETLESHLARAGGSSGRPLLPLNEVVRIGQEIAEGLAAAHDRGLIHRDIKPSNVWLEKERGRVKIVDFGLARPLAEDTRLTQAGNVVGTPMYMSPEQTNGQDVDARSDLFSLGTLLYQLCTGVTPFRAATTFDTMLAVVTQVPKPVRELNPGIPQALADLVMQLLAKKPDQRPATARAVMQSLQAIGRQLGSVRDPGPTVEQRSASAASASAGTGGQKRPGGRLRSLVVATVGLAAVLGLVVFLFSQQGNGPKPTGADGTVAQVPPDDPTKRHLPDAEFNKKVAALRGMQQKNAVSDRLKELNPGFPGIGPNKEGFIFTKQHPDLSYGIWKVIFPSDTVTDISPLAALTELGQVIVAGSKPGLGKLSDLYPLKDLKLTVLDISNTEVQDLSSLQGMASTLRELYCRNTRIKDLTGLEPLTELKELECDPPTTQADVVRLRLLPNLKKINGKARGEYLNNLKIPAPSKS